MQQLSHLPLAPVGIWTAALDVVGAGQAQDLAAELEDLGYGAIWLPEVAGRDVMAHLALLLSSTRRLVGATGIASIWARDAVTMTGGVKGLTEAFPERVLLGLGVSHHTLVEELRGHDYEKPLAAMRTYLDAMDASPYTAFRPTTPVHRMLAALGPKMLALAAERTDGAHSYLVPPEHTDLARKQLGAGPMLCVEQALLLEADRDRAREIGRAHTSAYVRLPNYQQNLRRLGYADADFVDGGKRPPGRRHRGLGQSGGPPGPGTSPLRRGRRPCVRPGPPGPASGRTDRAVANPRPPLMELAGSLRR